MNLLPADACRLVAGCIVRHGGHVFLHAHAHLAPAWRNRAAQQYRACEFGSDPEEAPSVLGKRQSGQRKGPFVRLKRSGDRPDFHQRHGTTSSQVGLSSPCPESESYVDHRHDLWPDGRAALNRGRKRGRLAALVLSVHGAQDGSLRMKRSWTARHGYNSSVVESGGVYRRQLHARSFKLRRSARSFLPDL